MLGKRRTESSSSFESLELPNVLPNMELMLRSPPIAPDDYLCESSASQAETETEIRSIYEKLLELSSPECVTDKPLDTDLHLKFTEKYLSKPLPPPFYVYDANHLWMVYWLLNPNVILGGEPVSDEMKKEVSTKIQTLIIDNGKGGIAGGPEGQIGHAASTYAALLLLVLVSDFETLAGIRENLYNWFLSLKHPDGSFAMHEGGERDVRSTYCVLVAASLLNFGTPELLQNTREWISSCQTYEGGFAGVPDAEAHGGYTFCAVASFFLLGTKSGDFDIDRLLRWLVARQHLLEGGFSGRTNKLVDGCYSFWVGAVFCLMEVLTGEKSLFNRTSLKTYIQNCCQELQHGGLRDKPGKSPDFYHTNYTLCGLSIAEHSYTGRHDAFSFETEETNEGSTYTLPINPVFGLPLGYAEACRRNFTK